jgi:hypothetical protein
MDYLTFSDAKLVIVITDWVKARPRSVTKRVVFKREVQKFFCCISQKTHQEKMI